MLRRDPRALAAGVPAGRTVIGRHSRVLPEAFNAVEDNRQDASAQFGHHDGVPTLRCSWGGPSGYGLATNVTLVTPEQAEVVTAALREGGFACVETGAELRCEMTKAFEEPKVTTGETHVFRANVWVSTRWINFNPTGYTDDIVAQLFA
ncbi:MAG TPA: hypothetical protein PLY66_07580 [Acidobacteriota bacterium]|nr:hypothetical protein [Acidobacteriota bacterium]